MRPMIEYIKYNMNESLIGVEIGVYKGEHSKNIIASLKIKLLYLIDPYVPYSSFGDLGRREYIRTHENYMNEMLYNLDRFSNKICFIRKTSKDAVNDIPNNLDFVYIDGNHSYESVREDISNYYPKIRVGGIIGGHDYLNRKHSGLTKAVNEFVEEYGYEVKTGMYNRINDWWIVKK